MHREDFPQINDNFAYLDNAATTMKPRSVIDAVVNFYSTQNANPRRGFYSTSVEATRLLEESRANIANYIGADAGELFFTSGATAGLNHLALSLGRGLSDSDKIAISRVEHHSNLLPWRKTGADYYYFDPFSAPKFSAKTKIVAISAFSNVLGKIEDLEKIIAEAHRVGAVCVVDATQAIAHREINFRDLGADFLVFSGHKIYGPMGIGAVCGKRALLENLQPAFWGGEMVDAVSDSGEFLADIPARFEAGTMDVAGAVGLSAAIDFLRKNNPSRLFQYEQKLGDYLFKCLQQVDSCELISRKNSTLCSFSIRGVHPHDLAQILADDKIGVRAGFHCAQLACDRPTVRASLSFYNTEAEINRLVSSLLTARKRMHVR